MPGDATIQTAVLAALPPGECLTVEALAEITGLSRRKVSLGAAGLIGRGLSERAEVGCFRLTDAGIAAKGSRARLTSGPCGPLTQTLRRPKRTTVRDKIWKALRIKGTATIGELLETAGVEAGNATSNAQRFCKALLRAGFLRPMRRVRGTALTSNGFARYQLLRNSGTRAPVVRVDGSVFDPNTGDTFQQDLTK